MFVSYVFIISLCVFLSQPAAYDFAEIKEIKVAPNNLNKSPTTLHEACPKVCCTSGGPWGGWSKQPPQHFTYNGPDRWQKMKKIVIFGATGMTGLCALEAAVKKGLQVRAFVRDPAKVPEHLKDKVEIFKGNVLEPDSVNDAIDGVDGVVVVLGTRNNLAATTDMSEGLKNIIDGMRAKNVKPVSVCLSAFLFYEDSKVPPTFVEVNADHKRMFNELKESPLDWIAVFPPHIADEPSREIVVEVNPKSSPFRTISKWDLGTFFIDSLSEPKYYKAVIGIANKPKAA